MKKNTIQLKNNSLKGHPKLITIQANENGVALDKFWRRRLVDAVTDNCVEILKPQKKGKKAELANDNNSTT